MRRPRDFSSPSPSSVSAARKAIDRLIYDLLGKVVLMSVLRPTIDISSLEPGAYILKLIPNRGMQFRSSVIIVE